MKLFYFYTIRSRRPLSLDLPMMMSLNGLDLTLSAADGDGSEYSLQISGPVVAEAIELVEEQSKCEYGATLSQCGLRVQEQDAFTGAGRFLCRFLGFLCQTPLSLASGIGKHYLESERHDDEDVFARLGTSELWGTIKLAGAEVWRGPSLINTERSLSLFCDREVALALYSDALRVGEAVARLREFWRILESAFGLKDKELVTALGRFKPLSDIEFDADEAKALWIIRGRASHAQSRGGTKRVRGSCERGAFTLLTATFHC